VCSSDLIKIAPSFGEIPLEWSVRVRYGPLEALVEGVASTWSMSVLTLKMLFKMLKLEVSAKNISGPITIAQYAGQTAKLGLDRFLMFLAVVSISLGVLNLLPIPILDGGHLMYYCIEAIKGSPVSERTMIWGQQFGILVLIGLMVLAFYNDLTRIFQ
jgi:regulator of sigma E protease